MLTDLSIRDVVLIEKLDLALPAGLCALTGETGAGKSIFLDALSLVLGARGDAGLVRKGAAQAQVSAVFDLPAGHPAHAILKANDIDSGDGALIIRRTLGTDGRSRAAINDQVVSIGLLRQVGETLVDIHGQFETQGLMDPKTHRDFLDQYAAAQKQAAATAAAWDQWQDLKQQRDALAENLAVMRRDQEYWEACLADLETLNPQPGEEEKLLIQRTALAARGQISETFAQARGLMEDDNGAIPQLNRAWRLLERIAPKAGEKLDTVLQSIDRAMGELRDAAATLETWFDDADAGPATLEAVDDRLHALRAQARKHQCQVDDLAGVMETMRHNLASIRGDDGRIAALDHQIAQMQKNYAGHAAALSDMRGKAAAKLDRKIMAELAPLKLERAQFRCIVEQLPKLQWGPHGMDAVRFEVSTNPGAPFGAINKIASGGELSRFMLAIKVVLSATSPVATLVFDEVDSGIGGATADAVGERLKKLADTRQVLVVTHSPQVAARADHHWTVAKSAGNGGIMRTDITQLQDKSLRAEEIARMLSGAAVTDAARAAAQSLLKTGT